jgi:CRISPR-associated protein Cas1
MIERIIEIADDGARLRLDLQRLMVEREKVVVASVPVVEIAALILGHPQITISQPLLAAVADAGGIVVVTDARRMPSGMLLPLQAFGLPAQRMRLQVAASQPRQKRIWRQVVRAKIRAQGRVLQRLDGDDRGLAALAAGVQSGDPANVEGEAARRYWAALFGPRFRRDRDGWVPNPQLNYGYAVLRAIVARSICGAGLHPCLGVHHHHRSNPFCLADDLMEPFRPLVDTAVVELCGREPPADVKVASELSKIHRAALLQAMLDRHRVGGEYRSVTDLVRRSIHAFTNALEDGTRGYRIRVP